MSEVKHTPGEWAAWQAPSGEWTVRAVYNDEQGRRATAWPAVCNAGLQNNEANAHLIAAAPNLLWFAEQIFAALDTGMISIDTPADETLANVLRHGRNALSKATLKSGDE